MDLIIPKILPDEFLGGYRGRIAAINGMSTPHEVAAGLGKLFPHAAASRSEVVTFVEAAAAFNGMEPSELMRRHTCMAVHIGFDRVRTRSGDPVKAVTRQWAAWLYAGVQLPRACPECIEDDQRSMQFSYWHRSHQLPGRFICPRHGGPLWHVPRQQLLALAPDAVAQLTYPFDAPTLALVKSNPYIAAAVGFLDRVLHDRVQLDRHRCAATLRGRINSFEHHTHGSIPKFRDQIAASLERAWVNYCMPAGAPDSKALINLIKRIIYVDTRRPSFTDVALVASVAYGCSDKACSAVSSTLTSA